MWQTLTSYDFIRNPLTSLVKGGRMKEYDVVIIGSGAGANLVEDALAHNKTVALVDKGPLGGTCLNVG